MHEVSGPTLTSLVARNIHEYSQVFTDEFISYTR